MGDRSESQAAEMMEAGIASARGSEGAHVPPALRQGAMSRTAATLFVLQVIEKNDCGCSSELFFVFRWMEYSHDNKDI